MFFSWCCCAEPLVEKSKEPMASSYLRAGDLLFWKKSNRVDRAGHVAVVTHASAEPKDIRVAHATDNPKYSGFVETHLPASEQIASPDGDRHYFGLRIRDDKIRAAFLTVLEEWLQKKIPFNTQHEKKMNAWDDRWPNVPTEDKVRWQHTCFHEYPSGTDISKAGVMCSEVIILALHTVLLQSGIPRSQFPTALQLDPVLCPPSTLMLAFEEDAQYFEALGRVEVPKFEFSPEEKQAHRQNTL